MLQFEFGALVEGQAQDRTHGGQVIGVHSGPQYGERDWTSDEIVPKNGLGLGIPLQPIRSHLPHPHATGRSIKGELEALTAFAHGFLGDVFTCYVAQNAHDAGLPALRVGLKPARCRHKADLPARPHHPVVYRQRGVRNGGCPDDGPHPGRVVGVQAGHQRRHRHGRGAIGLADNRLGAGIQAELVADYIPAVNPHFRGFQGQGQHGFVFAQQGGGGVGGGYVAPHHVHQRGGAAQLDGREHGLDPDFRPRKMLHANFAAVRPDAQGRVDAIAEHVDGAAAVGLHIRSVGPGGLVHQLAFVAGPQQAQRRFVAVHIVVALQQHHGVVALFEQGAEAGLAGG